MFIQRAFVNALRSPLTLSNSTSICVYASHLHTSTTLNRWYKHFFLLKRVFTPPKNPFTYDNDWENEPYSPINPNSCISRALNNAQFANIEDSAKHMFTYQFVSKRDQLNEQIHNELIKLGFNPTDQSVAARIIRMTMEIRYRKWLFDQHPRNKTLEAKLRASIRARQRLLRLLRLTNETEFKHLTSALRITGYTHPNPLDIPIDDPVVARKKEVKDQCYQLRLAKLANLKNNLRSTEQEFYKRKEASLNEILDKLASLNSSPKPENLAKQETSVLLRNLFDEVVKERQSDELSIAQRDQLNWYALEAKQREEYQAKQAQKAEKQLRRMRK